MLQLHKCGHADRALTHTVPSFIPVMNMAILGLYAM